ncbi:hypothetical protein SAMN05660420_02179 [Desulfuromusa kysingii]|uniref:Uncharacterized protein n=1 Tax=Desulfuromusa kysingii TaxID=37625 RepID=A0A1H4BG86_9BACT|nr:hypothetical protein [Desulfuromusa kysingii]SEA46812.1 hypothetical protein SAMN05660420_02179 [Desulfuromusa kysingii]
MFIQHTKLKSLNVPAEKITHLHVASSSVQLAFSSYPPQLCQAYLLQISGGNKVLIVVAFYLEESQSSIFFVPKFGELPAEEAAAVYEEGYNFVESMGFVLTESDYHLLSEQKKKSYWAALPICKLPKVQPDKLSTVTTKEDEELRKLRLCSLESLGRMFASL